MSNLPDDVRGTEPYFYLRDATMEETVKEVVTGLHQKWMTPTFLYPVPDLVKFAEALAAEFDIEIPAVAYGHLLRRQDAIDYVLEKVAPRSDAPEDADPEAFAALARRMMEKEATK